ncbi:MAG: hypothetical protein IT462_17860 [Planctomycetes bacterium]|nr:hypothetical protein [Planctomycetota bacterium]
MHPDFGQLVDYFRGELDASQAQSLRERLEHEADLFALWEQLKRTYAVIRSLPAPAPRAQQADAAEVPPTKELPLTTPRPAYVSDLRREFEARGWHNLLPWLTPAAAYVSGLRREFAVRAILSRLPLLSPRVSFIKALRVEFAARATVAQLPAMNVRAAFAQNLRSEFAVRSLTGSLPMLTPSERFKRRLKVAIYEASQRSDSGKSVPVKVAAAVPGLEPSDSFRRRLFAKVAKVSRVALRPTRLTQWQPLGRDVVARIKRSKSLAVTAGVHVLALILAFFVTPIIAQSNITPLVANVGGQYQVLPALGMPQPIGEVRDPRIALGPAPAPEPIDLGVFSDPSLTGIDDPPRGPEFPSDNPPARLPEFVQPALPRPAGAPIDAQAWFRLRSQSREKKIEYLGSVELYEALDRSLGYLRRTQEQDGGWGFKDPLPGAIPREADLREIKRVELTAAALLAYLGDGHSSKESAAGYDLQVSRGVKFLLSKQQPDGQIGPDANDVVLCHALATLALLEDYALTGDVAMKQPVRKACRWLAQSFAEGGTGKLGAFPYRRGQGPSLMTSVWGYLALASARNVLVPEADVPKSRLEGLMTWFADESRSRAVLEDQQDALNGDLVPTAAAAVLTLFAGDEGFDLRRASYLERIQREAVDLDPKGNHDRAEADMRYAFFGSLAHTLHSGDDGKTSNWEDNLGKNILKHQVRDGALEGSFENSGYYADLYGRVFSTAFAALSIENAYRVSLIRGR